MPVQRDELEQAIRDAFPGVSHLDVEDISSGCGQSYNVLIVSEEFEGKNTLARHRLINETLKDQIAQLHAFSQKTFTPKQYEAYLAKSQ